MSTSIESTHFPYLRLRVDVRDRTHAVDALIDTGFDGFVALPPALLADGQQADDYQTWSLADGRRVTAPLYLGMVHVGDLASVPAFIIALGNEPLVGRRVIDRFRLTLDHGVQVIIEL